MLTRDPRQVAPFRLPQFTGAPPARVLVDLSHASEGYVGVAQDIRLIFAMLCDLDLVDVAGLLMPAGRHDLPVVRPESKDAPALTAAVLHWMERNWDRPTRRPFPFRTLQRAQTLRQTIRHRHQLLRLSDAGQMNALWRILFAKTLAPEQRAQVLSRDFYATDLSVSGIIDMSVHSPLTLRKRLHATSFDAVLFSMPRPVQLPPGVRQIVRFHDAVPMTDTDTVTGWKNGLAHLRLVRNCAPDAIFVCNSPQSLQALLTIDPKRERDAVVIPCAVAPPARNIDGIDIQHVIARRISFTALAADQPATAPLGWAPPPSGMRYVLSVSTLEPRKNFSGLIRGWERVAARTDPDLRLVIVGGTGWREDSVLADMRPGVASGRILHLQNLPPDELQAVMRGAACFAFPSFNEGFGYSPLEALQAGAPCVVSDLPVFHWIFGDAAIYVDPYDSSSIAAGIESGINDPAPSQTRRDRVLCRFQPGAIGQAWEALLQTVRA